MTKRINTIWKHTRFWMIYWSVDMLLFALTFSGFLQNRNLITETLINLFASTIFFYGLLLFALPPNISHINVPKLLWRLVLIFIGCMALRRGCMLLMLEWYNFESAAISNYKFFFTSGLDILSRFGIYAALIWFFRAKATLQKEISQKELQEEKLQRELLEAKYAILKAQINPHFLFNTLNFIHSKAISTQEQALGKTVLLLSDVLRHTLRENNRNELVFVNDELTHIKKLYEINCLRFNGRYYLDILEEGAEHNKKIPPFILLTFFENAMKHGIFDETEHPVLVEVTQLPQRLGITVRNKIKQRATLTDDEQFSIGKRYVENILKQFYKENFILAYQETDGFHTVNLQIDEQ